MRLAFFLLGLCMLHGCMPNECLSAAAAAETNVYHISLLKSGMNQVEVLKIMRHPYSDQVYYLDEDIFDVWFYVTGNVVLGQSRMMPMNLTPLVFKNGILIGWGNSYYNMLKSLELEAERAKLLPPPTAPVQENEIENKEIEKSIEKTLQMQPQKPASPGLAPTSEPSKTPPLPQGAPTAAPVQENEIENKEIEKSIEKTLQMQLQKPASPGLAPTSEPSKTPPLPQGAPNQPQKARTRETGGSEKVVPSAPETPGKKGQSPQQQSAPNWSPLEKQKPEQPPSPQKPSSQVTMSRGDKKEESPDQGKEAKDRLPLNEEDEEILRQEREYDFDQTINISFF